MATSTGLADVRAWAREQGMQVADRGRLPAGVLDQYAAAHVPEGKAAKASQSKATTVKPASQRAPRTRAVTPITARATETGPKPDPQPAPPAPVAIETDQLHKELEIVRGEVTELRKHLGQVLARLTELEQPRSMFNRAKAKR